MKKSGFCLVLVTVSLCWSGAQAEDALWTAFVNPPAEAKPFVRWWWNGNCVTSNEIVREIGVLRAAGIGGFEINPIALPVAQPPAGVRELEWLSPEWNQLVRVAVDEARRNGMIADLIVGSGWPFGGEFLKPGEMTQRLDVKRIPITGPCIFRRKVAELLVKTKAGHEPERAGKSPPRIVFVRFVPATIINVTQSVALDNRVDADGLLTVDVPAGRHEVQVGLVEEGHVAVSHGAPGAKGPVLDHYNESVVTAYLKRMSDGLSPELGGKLGPLVRAIFCDSIELSRANWTSDFVTQFQKRRGYDVTPYLPYSVPFPKLGEAVHDDSPWGDTVRRARYDFARTVVELYQERFIQPFVAWCHANGVLCRYQNYGYPWFLGLLDGYLQPDIPESNNWLFSDPDQHGFLVWTKYAASGGHLANRRIISTEAHTNTRGVFKTPLEMIKAADDFNFVMGINHSVLHGFNYSPPEAGFPGWVRYGTYFSEQNTWWPQFRWWTAYNARLSAVFQATRPAVRVAILGPEADIWSDYGLERDPFQQEPWYVNQLWKALNCCGSNPDYVSEKVVQESSFAKGQLCYGPMTYDALIVAGVHSLQPATAQALNKFALAGGRVVFAGAVPHRAPSLRDVGAGDASVQQAMQAMLDRELDHDDANVIRRDLPANHNDLIAWANKLLTDLDIKRSVKFAEPNANIFSLQARAEQRDLFFLINTNATQAATCRATFQVQGQTAWRWNPEQGTRELFAAKVTGPLTIELQPLESMLLVFENDATSASVTAPPRCDDAHAWPLADAWQAEFHPKQGGIFTRENLKLGDLGRSSDPALKNFAGTVIYRQTFDLVAAVRATFLDLGIVHGNSEVVLNGQSLGVRWYGRHLFATAGAARSGANTLEIRVTVPLFNYVRTLKDNPTAREWTRGAKDSIPTGLVGPVRCAPAFK
ncbi:MAG: hypothetical protein EPN23_05065 [Verrucomicrobia bacterium]|nr:MAG: hypothetical protein EPN23_05065 [Verrucomicrobiota bacterium]